MGKVEAGGGDEVQYVAFLSRWEKRFGDRGVCYEIRHREAKKCDLGNTPG